MSNETKYNRALHCRAQGRIQAFIGDGRKAKSGVMARPAILSIPSFGNGVENWNVSCLLYGNGAGRKVGEMLECRGPVVDYGTRMETEHGGAKIVLPKLVFAASALCEWADAGHKDPAPDGKNRCRVPGMNIAVAGRIAWLGELDWDDGPDGCFIYKRDIGVAVADFPGMIGLHIRGAAAQNAAKQMMIYAEATVIQFGLSDDGKRPALKGEATRLALSFFYTPPNKGKQQ